MMNDGMIHIPAKKMSVNTQGNVKLTPKALSALAEVVNETGMSARQVASMIIIGAVETGLIIYDRED